MKIESNKVVSLAYTLKDSNGNVMDSSKGKEPLVYLHGIGHLIVGLENQLSGKSQGDKFNAEVAPEDAYGMYNDEQVVKVPLSGFDGGEGEELKMGMQVQMQGDQGVFTAEVVAVVGDEVTLDMNHPMAGKTLFFDIEVLEVRQATKEELSHGHVHGPGGHHH